MKKVIKRILLGLLILLVVIQVPFIYRRYKIGQLAGKIQEMQAQRTARTNKRFIELTGVIHAHTSLGGHSTGSFEELISGANDAGLDFVVMTEHYSDSYDTSALTLNGLYGKTFFVGGNEIDTADGDRFLMIPGSADAASFRAVSTPQVLEKIHSANGLAIITYPEKFRSWDSAFDGDEVLSLHTEAKQMNPFTAAFDLIWSYPAYPELMLAGYLRRPDANFAKFDEIAAKRRIAMSPGADAHSNIGFHVFGDDAGHKLGNIKLDPYKSMFSVARIHVLADKKLALTRESLIDALRSGRSFIGIDALGDTSGFSFTATDGRTEHDIGDETTFGPGWKLNASAPVTARFVVLKNGIKCLEVADTREISMDVSENGAYRVEVYLDQLGPGFDKMPWILSNPIYLR